MGDADGRTHDGAMLLDPADRVLDWREELLRVAPRLNELPDAARRAVLEVVGSFLREDADDLNATLLHSVRRALANAA
jgi:hypothetical protein